MVKAGAPVDGVIGDLAPLLDKDDIVIDAGNSHFADTRRRTEECRERGLRFIGTGVSGGEEGALLGPSIMPGGERAAYGEVEEVFTTIAAQVDGEPCCAYVGPDGAGHYVKMVHNGIEYADMQLIAEAYDLLRHGIGLDVPAIASIFDEWNSGDLESFLIEITATVLAQDGRGDRQAAGGRDRRPGRAEGHRALDVAGRAGARRAADGHHRGRVRAVAERVARSAPRGERRARGPDPGRDARTRSSTTSARRSTPRRSSPTRRASSRWRRPRARTSGTSTWASWPRSGAAAASSARGS